MDICTFFSCYNQWCDDNFRPISHWIIEIALDFIVANPKTFTIALRLGSGLDILGKIVSSSVPFYRPWLVGLVLWDDGCMWMKVIGYKYWIKLKFDCCYWQYQLNRWIQLSSSSNIFKSRSRRPFIIKNKKFEIMRWVYISI